MTNETLLDTEKFIYTLADELVRLKTAVQQYEETKSDLSKVRESVEKISTTSMSIAESSKAMVEMLEHGIRQLDENTEKLAIQQKRQSESIVRLEGSFKEQSDRVATSFITQWKLFRIGLALILAVLALGAVNLALLLGR